MDFKGIDLDNDGDNDLVIYRDNYQGDKDFYIYENKSSSEEIIFSSPIIYNTNPDYLIQHTFLLKMSIMIIILILLWLGHLLVVTLIF